ncbi:MAG: hypothetical protein EOP06_22290 [Proteobacteria bacterium]|nr:MAG: hypothetical protein EOP06_22290 [Pseudomonadota bacterium]
MAKNKTETRSKDHLPDVVSTRDVMVQISLKIEGDLLLALKERAKALHKPYQTLMKELLRAQLKLDSAGPGDQLLRLEKGVARLERILGRAELPRLGGIAKGAGKKRA